MSKTQQITEATLAAGGSKMTGAGSAVTVVGWITASDIALWVGIVIGFAGLFVNWYFKHKSDVRAHEVHMALMKKIDIKDGKIYMDIARNPYDE